MTNQHVTPRKDSKWKIVWWATIWEWNSRASSISSTQVDAIDKARQISINQESELFIHGKDNLSRARNSYWNDPEESVG